MGFGRGGAVPLVETEVTSGTLHLAKWVQDASSGGCDADTRCPLRR